MKKFPVPYALLPKPRSICLTEGTFAFAAPLRLRVPEEWRLHGERLVHAFSLFGMKVVPAERVGNESIEILRCETLKEEAFGISVVPGRIELRAGGSAGGLYGVVALSQLAAAAAMSGEEIPCCECCEIEDEPEFRWRGIMLDSVRHFQRVDVVRQVIRMMAAWRLRVLHLHLTDSQGWRIRMPWMENRKPEGGGNREREVYSPEELLEIAKFASKFEVEIVPEIDIPGHQLGFLRCCPEYSCFPDRLSGELCISSPEVKRFLTGVLQEVVRQIPSCRFIHLGGDETETSNWEACPSCRKLMRERNLSVRELERQFMTEMCGVVRSLGRTPICWCSDAEPPEGAVMQAWRISWSDIGKARIAGCPIINSISQNFYFDFPLDETDPHASAMPILNEEGIYHSSPYFFLNREKAGNEFLGVEACLWTETVPEWRVLRKLETRIQALSECAWTPVSERSHGDFLFRRMRLENSAWTRFANNGQLFGGFPFS